MKNRKLVKFQVFPDSAHPAKFEQHQSHLQLDDKFPYHGAHGSLSYGIHDNNWIHHI